MSMDSFFGSLFDMVESSNNDIDRCPECRISFGDFQRSGLLGCSYCYEHFSKSLIPTIFLHAVYNLIMISVLFSQI